MDPAAADDPLATIATAATWNEQDARDFERTLTVDSLRRWCARSDVSAIGRRSEQSPYFATAVLAVSALSAAGDDVLLPDIALGDTTATLAVALDPAHPLQSAFAAASRPSCSSVVSRRCTTAASNISVSDAGRQGWWGSSGRTGRACCQPGPPSSGV